MVNPKHKGLKRRKPTAFLIALGMHCKKLRKQRGYSIDRLAKEADRLSTSVIQRLETGSGPVNVTNLHRYAEALNLQIKDLFDFELPSSNHTNHQALKLTSPHSPGVEKLAFRTHLPVYSLKAAAGYFGAAESVEPIGWIEIKGHKNLDKKMFVARAQGSSMEPKIHDGDLLVFRADPEGTRQGKIVLAQFRGMEDPETGGSFAVKVYSSVKVTKEGAKGTQKQIILSPLNPDFEPIQLNPAKEEDFRIIAEYLYTVEQ